MIIYLDNNKRLNNKYRGHMVSAGQRNALYLKGIDGYVEKAFPTAPHFIEGRLGGVGGARSHNLFPCDYFFVEI